MKISQYLVIRPTSPIYVDEFDPVVGEQRRLTSAAGIKIMKTYKRLDYAKKYAKKHNYIVIPAL